MYLVHLPIETAGIAGKTWTDNNELLDILLL